MIKIKGKLKSNDLFLLIKICIAVFAIKFLIENNFISRQSLDILQESPFGILFASACYLISQLLASLRLTILLSTIDYKITITEAIKLTFMGNFVNNVVPGSIGGDIIKCLYLIKQESRDKGKSAGIVLLDRIVGLLTLVIIGVISAAFLLSLDIVPPVALRSASIFVFALFLACSTIILVILILSRNQYYRNKIRELLLKLLGANILFFAVKGLAVERKKYINLAYSFCVSFIIQLFALIGILSLGNLHPDFYSYKKFAAASSVVMLFNIIPVTPGNIGWTEMIAALSWSIIGSTDGAKIFFYWRTVSILCSLPGGFWYIFVNLYIKSDILTYRSRKKENEFNA